MDQNQKSYKTSLCWHYMNKGCCSLFDKCHFAHGKQQLRNKIDPMPYQIPPQCKPISIFKTQLCKYFMNGYCRNDKQCPFAHGAGDLQSMIIASQQPVKPDYGRAGQFLNSIFKNLQQVFPDEIGKRMLIKKGMELVQQNELPEANQIINELVHSNTLTQEQRQQCQTILANALIIHKINNGTPF